jgi:hypothetical protein
MKNLKALLKKVDLFERLAIYGDRTSFLQTIAQTWEDEARREGDLPEEHTIPAPPPEPMQMPEDHITAKPPLPTTPFGPSIDPSDLRNVQSYLNDHIPGSTSAPLVLDGKWGPLTAAKTLEWAKQNNLNLSLQQLVDILKGKSMSQSMADQILYDTSFDKNKYL